MVQEVCQGIHTKDINNILVCLVPVLVKACPHTWTGIGCLILECQDTLDQVVPHITMKELDINLKWECLEVQWMVPECLACHLAWMVPECQEWMVLECQACLQVWML